MVSSYKEFMTNPSSEPKPYLITLSTQKKLEEEDAIKELETGIRNAQSGTIFEQTLIKSSLVFWRIFAGISAMFACITAYGMIKNKKHILPLGVACSLSITYAVHFLLTINKAKQIFANYDAYLSNSLELALGLKKEANPQVEIIEDIEAKKFKAKIILTLPVTQEVKDLYLSTDKVRAPFIASYHRFSKLPLKKRVSLWGYTPQVKWV